MKKENKRDRLVESRRESKQFSDKEDSSRRILMLVTTLTFGGAETQVVLLARELNSRGWTVAVACLVSPTAYLAELEQNGIAVHSLNMPRGIPDLRAVFRLRSLIQSFQPDIVHCHMFHANVLGRVSRLFCKIPVLICTVHSMREEAEKGGATWHKELIYRLTDGLATQTTIICKAAFHRYIDVRAVPFAKLRIIPNGVDTERFARSVERRKAARAALNVDGDFVWLAVGRLVPAKDYPTLIRAIEKLAGERLVLLVAGSGPLETELRHDCAARNITEKIRFCGAREDILDLYNAADGFVMSSAFEGLSMALLEASSMGLPSVATRVGGNPEIVVNGTTGTLVDPGNADQVAVAMQQLMISPDKQKLFGEAAQRHCYETYRMSAVLEQWLHLYDDCLLRSSTYRPPLEVSSR